MGETEYLTHMTKDLNISGNPTNCKNVSKNAFVRLMDIVDSRIINGSSFYIPGMRDVVCFTEIELGKRYPKKMDLVSFVKAKNKSRLTDNYYGIAIPVKKNGIFHLVLDDKIHYKIDKACYRGKGDILKVVEEKPSIVDRVNPDDRWMFKRDNYWVYGGVQSYAVSFKWEREWRAKGSMELKDRKFIMIVKTMLEKQYLRCLFAADEENSYRVKPVSVISFEERVGVNQGEHSIPNNKHNINHGEITKIIRKMKELDRHEELKDIVETPFQKIHIAGYGGFITKKPSNDTIDSLKYFERASEKL